MLNWLIKRRLAAFERAYGYDTSYMRMLLDPTQQPLPEKLRVILESALQAWDAGQQEEVRSLLQRAVPLAEEMGYL